MCLTEEHYVPSYLSYLGLENETDCRGYLMSAVWNQYGSAHPKSYDVDEISPELCARTLTLTLNLYHSPNLDPDA